MALLDSHILTAILLCPVVGLGLVAAIPSTRPQAIKVTSALISGLAFGLSLVLWQRFDSSSSKLQNKELWF